MDPTTRHALLFHFFEVTLHQEPDPGHRDQGSQYHPRDSAQYYHSGLYSHLRIGRTAHPPSPTKQLRAYDEEPSPLGGGGSSNPLRIF